MSWQLNSSILAGSVDIYSEFASTASVDLVQTFFGSCGYAVFIAVVWNENNFWIQINLFPILSLVLGKNYGNVCLKCWCLCQIAWHICQCLCLTNVHLGLAWAPVADCNVTHLCAGFYSKSHATRVSNLWLISEYRKPCVTNYSKSWAFSFKKS